MVIKLTHLKMSTRSSKRKPSRKDSQKPKAKKGKKEDKQEEKKKAEAPVEQKASGKRYVAISCITLMHRGTMPVLNIEVDRVIEMCTTSDLHAWYYQAINQARARAMDKVVDKFWPEEGKQDGWDANWTANQKETAVSLCVKIGIVPVKSLHQTVWVQEFVDGKATSTSQLVDEKKIIPEDSDPASKVNPV